uniref:Uncharacterized protein n=1 Tax=Micrurus spixii TaxID=129469 RepID=A0A2D4M3W8_9SAUR
MVFFVRKGLLTYPIAQRYAENGIVVICNTQPVLFSFLTMFLLAFSSILEGPPVHGDVPVVPYFIHLLMIVFTVFHDISNALEIILYTSNTLEIFCTLLLTDIFQQKDTYDVL